MVMAPASMILTHATFQDDTTHTLEDMANVRKDRTLFPEQHKLRKRLSAEKWVGPTYFPRVFYISTTTLVAGAVSGGLNVCSSAGSAVTENDFYHHNDNVCIQYANNGHLLSCKSVHAQIRNGKNEPMSEDFFDLPIAEPDSYEKMVNDLSLIHI